MTILDRVAADTCDWKINAMYLAVGLIFAPITIYKHFDLSDWLTYAHVALFALILVVNAKHLKRKISGGVPA